MKTIACDFALTTGFAVGDEGRILCSGTETFHPKRGESPGFKWISFRLRFSELLDEQKPDLLVYETPLIGAMKSAHVAEVAFGLITRAQELCHERNIEWKAVHNTTIKIWATGAGNAKKEAMIAAAVAKWPTYQPWRDPGGDEADALHLLSFAMAGFPVLESAAEKQKTQAREAKAAALAAASESLRRQLLWSLTSLAGRPQSEASLLDCARVLLPLTTGAAVKRALAELAEAGRVWKSREGWRIQ